ncbi:MAG: putative capsular polysaccharide synthesis family protein [Verrucomicrobiota bacterium]
MSGIFGNQIKRLLRKFKHTTHPPDVASNYERRLNRLITSVTQTFEGPDKPVLVHTYGKVGSTAIHTSIRQLPGFVSFKTHYISEAGVDQARCMLLEHERDPIHLQLGEALRAALKKHPQKKVWVITLVRDPVARAVSDLFENAAHIIAEGEISRMPLERVVEIAAQHVITSLDYTEQWFDRELSGVLGFDFFARSFNQEQGFEIFREGRFELLAGKLELLSKNGADFLGGFFELGHDLPIHHARERSATHEASLYEEVRKNLKLPAAVLDQVYASRFCRHFYTKNELDGFRERWVQF